MAHHAGGRASRGWGGRRDYHHGRGRYWGGGVEWGEGHADPLPFLGWGVQTGYLSPPDADRTDSGPGWGESDNEIIYEIKR